ncbi:E2/UBC family protein [Sinorhizobium saheli]|uniref:E2/UBC family protein n=1 Tax=Sinorhizobium saheli TaxID=36856 RepID=UPI001294C6B5|nr:E2/UBC family protein [Sinorhizobium saheli]MQW85993.1 hypothetical protein [Sinorhizobium saheli]
MLPEFDREFLEGKELAFTEYGPDQGLRAVVVHNVALPEGKFVTMGASGQHEPVASCDVLIKIPDQYPDATLDSFYARPFLKLANSQSDPQNATATEQLLNQPWQFWSRHLNTHRWRPNIDSLATYWDLVRQALRSA